MDMRRPPGIRMIEPGIRARLDRHEAVFAFFIRHAAPGAGKVRVQRRVVLIDRMPITTRSVGLPDLDYTIGHRALVFIDHLADDDNTLAHRLPAAVHAAREIVLAWI